VLIFVLMVTTLGSTQAHAAIGDPVPDGWQFGQYVDVATEYRYTPLWPACNDLPCQSVGNDSTAVRVDGSQPLDIVGYQLLTYQNIGTAQFSDFAGSSQTTVSQLYESCGVYYAGAWYQCSEFSTITYTSSIIQNLDTGTAQWVYELSGYTPTGVSIIEVFVGSVNATIPVGALNPFVYVTAKRIYVDNGAFDGSVYGVGWPDPYTPYVALRHMDAVGSWGFTTVSSDYTAGDDQMAAAKQPGIMSWFDGISVGSIIDSNIISFAPWVFGRGIDQLQFDVSSLSVLLSPIIIGGTIISVINPVVDLALLASLLFVIVNIAVFVWFYSLWQWIKGFVL
jgi:hypothetical protein